MLLLIQTLELVAVLINPLLYCKALNIIHSKVYNVYADKVHLLITQQFKDEDIEGLSRLMSGITQYRMAVLLVVLFYRDFISREYSLDMLLEGYKIDELRECFRCVGIDLKLLFATVEIDICPVKTCGKGVESIKVETTLQIEKSNCVEVESTPSTGLTVNINELLAQNNSCTILIT